MFWFAGLVIFLSLLIWGAQFRWPSFLAANIKKIYLFFVFLCFDRVLYDLSPIRGWKDSFGDEVRLPPFPDLAILSNIVSSISGRFICFP